MSGYICSDSLYCKFTLGACNGEELGPLRWRKSPINMGIETVEYSSVTRKDNVDKKAHVGK
jgi:hypothetical protein